MPSERRRAGSPSAGRRSRVKDVARGAESASTLVQARIRPDEVEFLQETRDILGLPSTSDAIREALALLHSRAKEVEAAQQIREFHHGERAPVDEVTAALYGPTAYPDRRE